jgi:hypothetical protein
MKSGRQKIVLSFEACQRRADGNGSGGLVVPDQIQMIGQSFSFRFNLIALLLGQLEETIRNS